MFSKILIANRGEIACRVMRTARQTGHPHRGGVFRGRRRRAPRAPGRRGGGIGPAPARESYLDIARIIAAARDTGAQAIHPGYGFLSENEEFAAPAKRPGIVFIGPPVAAIRAMGSKSAAKTLMAKAGVPLVPGYHGDNQDAEMLAWEAERHRLSGADQGVGRRRRQGHAHRARGGRFRRCAGLVQARSRSQFRRRPRAGREVSPAPAPHRDPGLRRHGRQRRASVRARLLGAAPPPEGARGSARRRA